MPANTLLKKSLAKLGYIFTLILIFSLIFFSLVFFDNYFQVKKIKIVGSKINIFGLNEITGKNIIFISEEKIKEILKEKNPLINSLLIEKKYPDTLVLKITLYQPIGELIVNSGYFQLAEDGKIIAKSKKENEKIAKINFYQKLNYQSYNQGEIISFKEILDGLYFLQSLIDMNIKADSLDINGINMIVFKLENKKIIFSSEKNKELQVFQVKEIIRRFKIEGKNYKEIDLRFDKPVIRF